jgi:enoyl-[acyl-carrier-protein] reductase (NADH)
MAFDDMRQEFLNLSPLRRMTTADDIAEAALFLASDQAKNISGQVLAVNAGDPAG